MIYLFLFPIFYFPACPRGVGNENFQNEMGIATFTDVNVQTGETNKFTQNKRMYYYEGEPSPLYNRIRQNSLHKILSFTNRISPLEINLPTEFTDSILPIEWTDQHGCGSNSKVSCEIVLQYACEDTLDPLEDNFWPWVQNKAQVRTASTTTDLMLCGVDFDTCS